MNTANLNDMEQSEIIDQLYDRIVTQLGGNTPDDDLNELRLLTREQVADVIGCSKENVTMLQEVGVIKAIRTGKGFMTPRGELLRFYADYRGYDVSNRVRAMKAKEAVENS